MHRRFYPKENSPVTHFTGGRVGLGSGFDEFKKLRPHRGSNPKPSTPIASPNTIALCWLPTETRWWRIWGITFVWKWEMEMENNFSFLLQTPPRRCRKIFTAICQTKSYSITWRYGQTDGRITVLPAQLWLLETTGKEFNTARHRVVLAADYEGRRFLLDISHF